MSGLGSGFVNLFKSWGKGIGKAADNFLLKADARKAISDEVRSKFKPKIDLARAAENKRAANITELDKKLTQSKKDLADAQKAWQDKYNSELAAAKAQKQTDIGNYDTKLQEYQDAVTNASTNKKNILTKLREQEDKYDKYNTIFTDVNSGKKYIVDPYSDDYIDIGTIYQNLSPEKQLDFIEAIRGLDKRLFEYKSGRVINAFDKSNKNIYGNGGYDEFDKYLSMREGQNANLLRNLNDAENQVKQARNDLKGWKKQGRPNDWNDSVDLQPFDKNFRANNAEPTEYSFNGQTYKDATALDNAYQDALKHETALQNSASKIASKHILDQKAEIAKRIQDAKDIKKAKLALGALGAGAGAGALYAGARAMYGGDDTDNTDNIDNTNNIDNTDNTYTGKSDPAFNVENTPEGKAAFNGKSILPDTGFDPDIAEAKAVLAGAAYDKGVEDSNSIESSDDHFIDDAELYGLLKAMKDPYKADAVANYIYSKHGNESDVQNLGWRGWLNKYYGDLLRSKMNIDPSGYKGMHISGGL